MIISVSKSFVAFLISSALKSIAELRIYWIRWRLLVTSRQLWLKETLKIVISSGNVLRQVAWILNSGFDNMRRPGGFQMVWNMMHDACMPVRDHNCDRYLQVWSVTGMMHIIKLIDCQCLYWRFLTLGVSLRQGAYLVWGGVVKRALDWISGCASEEIFFYSFNLKFVFPRVLGPVPVRVLLALSITQTAIACIQDWMSNLSSHPKCNSRYRTTSKSMFGPEKFG